MDHPVPTSCEVRAWKPDAHGIAEVLHAHIVDWAYPAHAHDTWTVLTVDRGAIDYALDSRSCAAPETTVAILPPGVVHDGRPAQRAYQGFWKRNLYLDATMIPTTLIGAAVDRTVVHDLALRQELSSLHDALASKVDAVEIESRLAVACERIRHHLEPRRRLGRAEPSVAHDLRQVLDDGDVAEVRLRDVAQELDRSIPHLIRSFSAVFGVSPHAYLIGRRVEAARRLLLDGVPAAIVAVSCGFHDQAHLTRHFKQHTATTPARFARRHTRPQG